MTNTVVPRSRSDWMLNNLNALRHGCETRESRALRRARSELWTEFKAAAELVNRSLRMPIKETSKS